MPHARRWLLGRCATLTHPNRMPHARRWLLGRCAAWANGSSTPSTKSYTNSMSILQTQQPRRTIREDEGRSGTIGREPSMSSQPFAPFSSALSPPCPGPALSSLPSPALSVLFPHLKLAGRQL
eukprot:352818-Chlamydomonas_euryale.AAC.5